MSNNHETLWNNQENSIEQNRHINSLMVRFIRENKAINRKKKGVPAYSLTNVSRNSRTFPHSITNKEGGNGKSSKFETNDKRVRNHPSREMIPGERFKNKHKSINS